MATRKTPTNQSGAEHEHWAQKHLKAYRDHLVPSSAFYAQTKAQLFQKLAADKERRARAWYIMPNAVQKWAGIVTAASVLAGVLFAGPIFAPKVSLAHVGEFNSVQGTVFIRRADGTQVQVQSNDKIYEGDTIEVASASKAEITIAGDAQAELAENTKIHVEDVMTMRVDNAIVSSQVHLELEQGTYVQKKTDAGQASPTLITLATPSGTIKSSAYADYVVSADGAEQVAVSVHSSGVTVLREGEDALLAAGQVVQEGQSVLLNNDDNALVVFATTDLQTATGSLIATLETTRDSQEAPKTAVTRTTRDIPASPEDKEPILTAPETPSIDVSFRATLEDLQSQLEIAEIKMQQVITYYNQGETEMARIAMSGYVSTAKDVYKALSNNANSNAAMIASIPNSLDDIVQQSPLVEAYHDLSARTNIDKTSAPYQNTLSALEVLSRAEAALRLDIASPELIASQTTDARTMAMKVVPEAENTNTATAATEEKVNVRTYTKNVQTGIYGQVEAIVADPDNKSRTNAFANLLARIPNDTRNIPMLERIQTMVPQSLRGFVEVKIHRIKYPEAKN